MKLVLRNKNIYLGLVSIQHILMFQWLFLSTPIQGNKYRRRRSIRIFQWRKYKLHRIPHKQQKRYLNKLYQRTS